MKISVCMMVKNEEALLGRALSSTLGLADEIVIVDTGSTDGTLRIAEDFGAVIIQHGDHRHKAQARNLGLNTATGDWLIVLDADEVIADPVGVRAYLESTKARAVYIRECYMSGDRTTLSFAQMRIWRKIDGVPAYLYRFRAHEVPLPTTDWSGIEMTDFVWEHRPPANGREWKRDHMLMLLLMDVEENPNEPRPLYYLGREYMYLGAWTACVDTIMKYFSLIQKPDRDTTEAHGILATAYKALGKTDKMISELRQAMAMQPENRAWPCMLAEHFHLTGEHTKAEGYLRLALSLERPKTGYVDEKWYGAYPLDLLSRILYYNGKIAEGKPFIEQACALEPDNDHYRSNLAFFTTQ